MSNWRAKFLSLFLACLLILPYSIAASPQEAFSAPSVDPNTVSETVSENFSSNGPRTRFSVVITDFTKKQALPAEMKVGDILQVSIFIPSGQLSKKLPDTLYLPFADANSWQWYSKRLLAVPDIYPVVSIPASPPVAYWAEYSFLLTDAPKPISFVLNSSEVPLQSLSPTIYIGEPTPYLDSMEPLSLKSIPYLEWALGQRKPVVVCVDFPDVEGSYSKEDIYDRLFGPGTYPGTLYSFYYDQSYGKLSVKGTVYFDQNGTSWITLSHNRSYYNQSWDNFRSMLYEIINLVDPYINFADHDADNDGQVDGFLICYAGDCPWKWDEPLWPHMGWVGPLSRDGKQISKYFICFEKNIWGFPVGVYSHEFGHILGAVDLYDYDGSSLGCGKWSQMSRQEWYATWPGFDPYHRVLLGWATPRSITFSTTYSLSPIESQGDLLKYTLSSSAEYFLIENRRKTNFDFYLPGQGMLIWHIDESVGTNDNEWYPGHEDSGHYRCALEQADGQWHLERAINSGDPQDPFGPGLAFTPTSSPNSYSYDRSAYLRITDIQEAGDQIVFKAYVPSSNPILSLSTLSLDFGTSLTSLTFRVRNDGGGTLQWEAVESIPWVTSLNPSSGSLLSGESANVTVTVQREGLPPGNYTGSISLSSNGGNAAVEVKMTVPVSDSVTITNLPATVETQEHQPLSFQVQASDSSGHPLTFTILSGPGTINSGTGQFNWNDPTPVGEYAVRIRASCSQGQADEEDLTIRVNPPPMPPSVETLPAKSSAEDCATLNGSVNPNGQATDAWFEWGTTTSYGNSTFHQDMGTGTSTIAFSALVTGLDPDTTYHFRAVAHNSLGTSYGEDRIFIPGEGQYQLWLKPSKANVSSPQEDLTLVLKIGEIQNITSISCAFTWDPSKLSLRTSVGNQGVELGSLFVGGLFMVTSSSGRVDLTLGMPSTTVNGPGEVARIHFTVSSGLANGTVIQISFNSSPPPMIMLGNGGILNPTIQGSTLTVVGSGGNQFQFQLTSGWNMISLPLITDPNPLNVFSSLSGTWYLYQWDPVSRSYKGKDQISLQPGIGLWLRVQSPQSLTVQGTPFSGTEMRLSLSLGWNLVGYPFLSTLNWSDVRIGVGSNEYTLDQAASLGVISPYLYWWNGTGYANVKDLGKFEAGKGYWIRALQSCTLIFREEELPPPPPPG